MGSEARIWTPFDEPTLCSSDAYSTYTSSEDEADSGSPRSRQILPAHHWRVPNTSFAELSGDNLVSEWSTPPLSPASSNSSFGYFEDIIWPRLIPLSNPRTSTISSSRSTHGLAGAPPELISRSTTVVGLEALNAGPHHNYYSSFKFTEHATLSSSSKELVRWLKGASGPAAQNSLQLLISTLSLALTELFTRVQARDEEIEKMAWVLKRHKRANSGLGAQSPNSQTNPEIHRWNSPKVDSPFDDEISGFILDHVSRYGRCAEITPTNYTRLRDIPTGSDFLFIWQHLIHWNKRMWPQSPSSLTDNTPAFFWRLLPRLLLLLDPSYSDLNLKTSTAEAGPMWIHSHPAPLYNLYPPELKASGPRLSSGLYSQGRAVGAWAAPSSLLVLHHDLYAYLFECTRRQPDDNSPLHLQHPASSVETSTPRSSTGTRKSSVLRLLASPLTRNQAHHFKSAKRSDGAEVLLV
ncbi:hypothetical protein NP233_g11554 [Leucocoprinus birnbaumii]|uniref:Uncharacterized protein n=1 Tax=Leucocoprinus birnbaumii TaxID=56174 RepID=A0AAD5VI85_9AGAR|nr:hypothetical protein NP233_g11554 [Leucocoprinus birnbaumii]